MTGTVNLTCGLCGNVVARGVVVKGESGMWIEGLRGQADGARPEDLGVRRRGAVCPGSR